MRKLLIILSFGFLSCRQESKSIPAVTTSPTESDSPVAFTFFKETQNITSAHGPSNITRNVLQDRNGNIWCATWEGILCYDGKLFTNYTLKAGLKHFNVISILEDRAANLWFGTVGGGVHRYDGRNFTLFTTKHGLTGNAVLCMLEDKAGNIWLGTENGVSRFDSKTFTFTNFTKQEIGSGNSVNSIAQDKTGKLWFGTRGGLSCYDGKSFTPFADKEEGRSFHNVRSIIEDKTGNIWIGSEEGLCRYDPSAALRSSGNSFTYFTKNFIGYIFEDKTGNLWLSQGDGRGAILSRYDGKSFSKMSTKFYNQVFGITQDSYGNIWFGTETGVSRYDGKFFTDFKEDESKP